MRKKTLPFSSGKYGKYRRTCTGKVKRRGSFCTLANARFVKPFDKELVDRLAKNHRLIVTMEENAPRRF